MYGRVVDDLLRRIDDSVLVLGPRQVGKSTLLSGLKPDITINLADPSAFVRYAARPETLGNELRGADRSIRTIFVDEIQKVPPLLDQIQVLIDNDPNRFRFLLSGSSARKLRRGGNLLAGRVTVVNLHPLLACELGAEFDLDRSLAHGTLPGVYALADQPTRARRLRAYANTYIREEVQAEALVRDIGGYARLLDLVAASSGRVLNVSGLAQDAGLGFDTTRRYISVLEDTLVAFTVPAWRGSDRASLLAHPRLFLFDAGVRNALLRRPLDRPAPDERGYLLEHLIAHELYRRLGELWPEASLHHFRTRHGVEVDFVVDLGRELWAIEVKASASVSSRDTSGLRAMAGRVRAVKRCSVVYLGARRQILDGIEALPLARFLESLPGDVGGAR